MAIDVVVVVDFDFVVVVGLIRLELRCCGGTRFVGIISWFEFLHVAKKDSGPSGSNDSSGTVSTGAKNLLSPHLLCPWLHCLHSLLFALLFASSDPLLDVVGSAVGSELL